MSIGVYAILAGFILTTNQVHGAFLPADCEYTVTNGGDYRGNVSVTGSGLSCQPWDAQSPHRHVYTPATFPTAGLDHNFCRNPDGKSRPWCYTTDPSVRFEYCNVSLCEFQFHQYNGYFYKYVTDPQLGFYAADDHCQTEGGFLASAHSAEENDFIWTVAGPTGGWIGLTVTNTRVLAWQDSTPVDYTQFHPGEPRYSYGIACTTLWRNKDGNWDDTLCGSRANFVCKKQFDKCSSGIVSCPDGFFCDNAPGEYSCYCNFATYRDGEVCKVFHFCPEGWAQLEDSCFKEFNQTRRSHAEAQAACAREGARLVAVTNSSTYRFLTNYTRTAEDVWIGLQYEPGHGAFQASDGVNMTTDPGWGLWDQGLWSQTTGCGYLVYDSENNVTIYTVNVSSCDVDRAYICETTLTQKDDCTPNPCVHAEGCEDQWAAYTCHCQTGWTGVRCDIDIDECLTSPCQNNAPCINNPGGFECDCPAGYSGPICLDDINECDSSPCQNDGLCVDMIDTYTCTCTEEFTGGHCQTSTGGTPGWVIALAVILPLIVLSALACIIIAALKRKKRRKGVSPAISRRSSEEERNNGNNGTGEK
ncbi:PREDICTED: fibropellin-1-like [Branchiostoma belcheri]|uniref:Fibropellin-1-like n=1 Tax=Branchiostoma belcheri TaxID=7741 RepID=A0A6P4YKH3_BRABE|nr:PREDICTED: fibropellin-1-like [Branchiostoma belcheri]